MFAAVIEAPDQFVLESLKREIILGRPELINEPFKRGTEALPKFKRDSPFWP